MFNINGLDFSYGKKTIFNNCAFALPERGVVELRGENGTGKTTLLKILSGILRSPNESVQQWRRDTRALFFDENILSTPHMTVREYLDFLYATFYPDVPSDVTYSLITPSMFDTHLGELSLGQRKRVVFEVAFTASAWAAVLMDEPFNGLDNTAKDVAATKIQEIGNEQLVIVATHDSRALGGYELRIDDHGVIHGVQ